MHPNSLVTTLFLIFCGAAVFSTLALYTRQSLLVAYMVLGILIGPFGLRLVGNSNVIQETGDVGIIFLLFLLGLHLDPRDLLQMFRKVSWIALFSSLIFIFVGYIVAIAFGFSQFESLIIGVAMMFSSTIIGLKLLPTTVLHHQHTGELMIGILLMQDLIAIAALLFLHAASIGHISVIEIGKIVLSLPSLFLFAFMFERFVLDRLFSQFDRIREYLFLLAIAWCLTMSFIAGLLGLSYEVGAFIAGVSIATGPISLYIAESMKPVRDFFLVMFFFSVGAGFNSHYIPIIGIPALILTAALLIIKPYTFRLLLQSFGESKHIAWEVGVRLGQISEFSLLIAYLGANTKLLSTSGSYLIQATTLLTFIVSSYWVVLRFPTPVSVSEKMRRD
ncbi:MAG: cation:proton antiporter [Gammaproteobacteria bacterium]